MDHHGIRAGYKLSNCCYSRGDDWIQNLDFGVGSPKDYAYAGQREASKEKTMLITFGLGWYKGPRDQEELKERKKKVRLHLALDGETTRYEE